MADTARTGRRVLVRCQAGYNRSGLVVALALMRLGFTGQDAVARVRIARGPYALSNPHFLARLVLEDSAGRS